MGIDELPQPETEGHAAVDAARAALARGDTARAVDHLMSGLQWAADAVVVAEERLIAVEAWARGHGYSPPRTSET